MRRFAIVLLLASPTLAQGAFWAAAGASPGERLGAAVAVFADLNQDGVSEVIVGSPGGQLPTVAPSVFGFAEVRDGRTGAVLRLHAATTAGTLFGHAVAVVPDLDGDGFRDYLIGEPLASPAPNGAAGLVRYFSGASGTAIGVLPGGAASRLGSGLLSAGDHDGDGFGDFLVHAEAGAVFLISGSTGLVMLNLPAAAATAMAAVGDLNGDAIGDFVLGFPAFSGALALGGACAVHSGANGAILAALPGPVVGAAFGRAVAAVGDVDGDGFADFAVGAPGSIVGPVGRVYVYSGQTLAPLWVFAGGFSESAGAALAIVLDRNGDGVSELAVGGPTMAASGAFEQGIVRVLSGTDGGFLLNYRAPLGNPPVGKSIVAGLDVNADGADEILLADPLEPNGQALGDLRVVAIDPVIGPAGNGPPTLLRVNGSSGGASGRVDILPSTPVTISLAAPTPTSADFVLFGCLGVPEPQFAAILPGGVGSMFVPPLPLFPWSPALFTLASSFPGAGFGALLPAPAYPAPWAFTLFGGSPVPVTVTLQAIVETAPFVYAVTNAVILRIR